MSRIMISGTNSGCGKTTVVCAVLQALADRGENICSFKCGPDYIDPLIHKKVIGVDTHNLDSCFCTKDTLNYLIDRQSDKKTIIEGVMGFYDGINGRHSSYTISCDTNTPVVIVIDCKGMSESIAAVMKGFLTYKEPNNIVGFIFNRLPESLVPDVENMCDKMNVRYFGRFPDLRDISIKSRHLGLAADDIDELRKKIKLMGALAQEHIDLEDLFKYSIDLPEYKFTVPNIITKKTIRIVLSSDDAFCFWYHENTELLTFLGCEIVMFSPLHDKRLPKDINGIILTGGYPELYAKELSENHSMLSEIKNTLISGIPAIAECGGFMYLHDEIEDAKGDFYPMVGSIKGRCFKRDKLSRFGYIRLTAKSDNLICKSGESLKAHEFHYWESNNNGDDFICARIKNGKEYNGVHSSKVLYAGFPHLYFYSNIDIAVNFVKACEKYGDYE